jgi:hypothetical protein
METPPKSGVARCAIRKCYFLPIRKQSYTVNPFIELWDNFFVPAAVFAQIVNSSWKSTLNVNVSSKLLKKEEFLSCG